MSFWEFANNHPLVTLFCVLGIASAASSSVKHIARAVTGRGAKKLSGKVEIKTPKPEPKVSTEKAH